MNRTLSWRVIKELNRLYHERSIKTKDSKNLVIATDDYLRTYEQELEESYITCARFIEQNDLERPYWDFLEKDIQTLIAISEKKHDLIEDQWTKNQISSFYFRDEDAKYLRTKRTLANAVLKILELDEFPEDERDQQYIHVINCYSRNPKAILLCENFDKLRLPDKYRKNNIELWYAGGRNIAKLGYIRENETLPIFYVCDWDYDGLDIYRSIKTAHIPSLKLIFPENWKEINKPIKKHKSKWKNKPFLKDNLFFEEHEQLLINQLISENKWVEEETISFSLDQITLPNE